ncbi:MAG: protein tyrosine phosphatase family protein [Hydrogenophilales bacterium]|nr:protein tyrosine phosphatase family protein [Hydrogenophilales bacterium]
MIAAGALDRIYHFRWRAPDLATAGQPLEAELRAVADAGFEVVINLALLDAEYSLPDEPGLVRSLGMAFFHIPVIWESPTLEDLQQFFTVMRQVQGRKVFLHCAANMRVSVFLALYRILQLGWSDAEAMALVTDIWEPDAVWQAFIQQALSSPSPY